jgi:ribosomal protein L7Ae-like RNA K-turn-binding protein
MSESSDGRSWVIGVNQSLKLIRSGKAKRVILAKDADAIFVVKVKSAVKKAGDIEVDTRYTSHQLAEKAGVDVPTAIITEF